MNIDASTLAKSYITNNFNPTLEPGDRVVYDAANYVADPMIPCLITHLNHYYIYDTVVLNVAPMQSYFEIKGLVDHS